MNVFARPYRDGIAICAEQGIQPIFFTVHDGLFRFKKKAHGVWYEAVLSSEQIASLAALSHNNVLIGRKNGNGAIATNRELTRVACS